jgi:hypothetical protein
MNTATAQRFYLPITYRTKSRQLIEVDIAVSPNGAWVLKRTHQEKETITPSQTDAKLKVRQRRG